jgi:hypothetical protein
MHIYDTRTCTHTYRHTYTHAHTHTYIYISLHCASPDTPAARRDPPLVDLVQHLVVTAENVFKLALAQAILRRK